MENSINIGQLDEMVTVQRCIQSQGTQGQKQFTWENHSRVWAKIVRNIDEMVGSGNLEEGNSLEVTIYKIQDLTSRWRIVVDNIPYEIVSINPVSRVSPLNVISLRAIN